MNAYVIPGLQTKIEQIESAAALAFGINVNEIYKKCRKPKYSDLRLAIFYYRYVVLLENESDIIENTGYSRYMVYHAIKTVPNYLKTDPNFKRKYDLFIELMG